MLLVMGFRCHGAFSYTEVPKHTDKANKMNSFLLANKLLSHG